MMMAIFEKKEKRTTNEPEAKRTKNLEKIKGGRVFEEDKTVIQKAPGF